MSAPDYQRIAADPTISAFVTANAGSGKTFVLARRVIRLLLAGVAPARILCLTFTKAAAAEMSNRIFETLAGWVTASGDDLAATLTDVLGRAPQSRETARARTLFALALDTPGGLKIQTIHAFCEALLHQFPLEANVPGHFEVVEELRQTELLEEARLGALREMERGGADRLREAFDFLIDHASDAAIDKALGEIIGSRTQFDAWIGGDFDEAMRALWERLGFTPETTEADILDEAETGALLSDAQIAALAETATRFPGAWNDAFAARASAFLAADNAQQRFTARRDLFLTDKGPRKQWVTGKVFAEHPGMDEELAEEAVRIALILSRLSLYRSLRLSAALFYFADEILARYERAKRANGLVDFADLIARAANLLGRADVRDWVRYKLDRGIDHVLIDEAQDTSLEQWSIVDAVTDEFFAGKGSWRGTRTVFAVGDEKQSIFSFQGAAPEMFSAQKRAVERRSRDAGMTFESVELRLSFRSSPDILGAVDKVFSEPDHARGLGTDDNGTVHTAIRASDPGEVRIWPIHAREETAEKTEWLAPIDTQPPGDPAVELAKRIAGTIRGWIDDGEKLPGTSRPIRHGDILILVRRRDRFMTAVIRELKEAGLSIAGADRLKLTEHIAVEDLMALGRVMVLPEDDLALAGVLKSPLFGLDDNDLIALASQREGVPLFDHLVRLGEGESPVAALARGVHQRLERMRVVAASANVHGFYAHVLGRMGGRRAFVSRLGNEAEDVLDAFEKAALDHERQGESAGGLETFLAELMRASPEIKREVDVRRDEIRVITVHAAKGLEAPIVFLVDPCSPAFIPQHAPSVIRLGDEDGAFLWATGAKDAAPEIEERFAAIKRSAEEEYRRLLYVAMTRAADRLIVCGYRGVREPREPHWHAMIDHALRDEAREVVGADGEIVERIWQSPDAAIRGQARERPMIEGAAEDRAAAVEAPAWLTQDAKREAATPRPLSPSAALALKGKPVPDFPESSDAPGEPAAEVGISAEERRAAMARGVAVHRLLQMLPDTDPAERENLAARWLERQFPDWSPDARDEALGEAMRLIGDTRLAPLFAPGSRAEAAIAGNVAIGGSDILVSGQIDRLALHEHEIVLADYKTNRFVPEGPDQVSEAYLLQMALYRALLRQIYPGRQVRCLLIWTRDGTIHELDNDSMEAALARTRP